MADEKNSVLICPLLSINSDSEQICRQENCAWFLRNYKVCATYMLAHNAMLDVQVKQAQKKQNSN